MTSRTDRPDNTYTVRTYGCQMNVHDSEHMAGVLEAAGYTRTDSIEEAGVVIFNTCCVRQSAEDRVWGNLGALKASSRRRVVAVCGCMAQRHGTSLMERSPAVGLVFGMDALKRLPELIDAARRSKVCDLGDVSRARIDCLPASRESVSMAWVPISHGCDNNCAYCIVPLVRGPERSRPKGEVMSEVEYLASRGVVEIRLLGQNVNSYGRDLDAPRSFADLLESVAGAEGIRRVKYETSHPADLFDGILDVMGSSPGVCEYLHLPVQSGSDAVLADMNRGYGREYFVDLVERARSKVAGLRVTTDIIVGFPTETDRDFELTLDLIERVRFDAAYIFMYSRREGTPAASLGTEVDQDVKRRRLKELAEVQAGITADSLAGAVGSRVEVLLEGPARKGAFTHGRTRGNAVVLVSGAEGRAPIVEVLIDAAGKRSLRGTILAEEIEVGRDR